MRSNQAASLGSFRNRALYACNRATVPPRLPLVVIDFPFAVWARQAVWIFCVVSRKRVDEFWSAGRLRVTPQACYQIVTALSRTMATHRPLPGGGFFDSGRG